MARTATKTNPTEGPKINEAALERAESAASQLVQLQEAASGDAKALASRLGYEGSLTIGALEDQIRWHQRRTIEAVMGLGASLLLLRELTQHGDFAARVELLGISSRMAQKFMSAALKFSNANSSSLLKAAGNQTKLLELVALDDDEIEVMASGGSARGITVDKLDAMSVSELKKALRQSEKDAQFNAEKRQKAEARADAMEKELGGHRPVVVPVDERVTPFQVEITERQSLLEKGLDAHLESVAALEAWWNSEQDDGDGSMPRSVKLVLLTLDDAVTRSAHMVAKLQNELAMRFGGEIDAFRQYLMANPAEQEA